MTATEPAAAPPTTRGRARNVALWVLQVLLAATFAFAGVNKLFGLQQEMVDNFNMLSAKLGVGLWFRYLVGALELAGAIGLLIPRLAGPAALGLAGVMAGAVLTHLFLQPPAVLALIPATLGALFVLIARARWPRFEHPAGRPVN